MSGVHEETSLLNNNELDRPGPNDGMQRTRN